MGNRVSGVGGWGATAAEVSASKRSAGGSAGVTVGPASLMRTGTRAGSVTFHSGNTRLKGMTTAAASSEAVSTRCRRAAERFARHALSSRPTASMTEDRIARPMSSVTAVRFWRSSPVLRCAHSSRGPRYAPGPRPIRGTPLPRAAPRQPSWSSPRRRCPPDASEPIDVRNAGEPSARRRSAAPLPRA